MSSSHVKYVLVGGGAASGAAAIAIRQRDPEGSILLVGQEVNRPYHRPALSRDYLLRQTHRRQLFTVADQWFAENRVQLCTGRRASSLDTARHAVLLDNGQDVAYEQLLIATGGSPVHMRVPGSDLPNVFYLRTLEDADRVRNAVEKARQEGKRHELGRGGAAVIGGGLLGIELAGTFAQMGLAVKLIEAGAWPWCQFAGETVGRLVARRLEKRGVSVHLQTAPVRIDGDGRVQRMTLSSGMLLELDLLVAAIGLTPHKELLRATAIASENAVLVDEHCRTSVADVYAAGDCAAIYDPLFARHRWIDHWEMATETGRIAGLNMAGDDVKYDQVNCHTTQVLDLSASIWGESRHISHRIVRGMTSMESPDFIEIGVDNSGRISHVVAINHATENDTLRELVRRRLNANEHDAVLRDPSRSLAGLLR